VFEKQSDDCELQSIATKYYLVYRACNLRAYKKFVSSRNKKRTEIIWKLFHNNLTE